MKKSLFSTLILSSSLLLATGCKTSKADQALSAQDLTGKWNVTTVNNQEAKAEKAPFIEFTTDQKVHAELGCNIYNSTYTYSAENGELTFPDNGQRTMMFCPDMATEDAIIKAISETKKVRKADNKSCIELTDEQGNTLMTLCK